MVWIALILIAICLFWYWIEATSVYEPDDEYAPDTSAPMASDWATGGQVYERLSKSDY